MWKVFGFIIFGVVSYCCMELLGNFGILLYNIMKSLNFKSIYVVVHRMMNFLLVVEPGELDIGLLSYDNNGKEYGCHDNKCIK